MLENPAEGTPDETDTGRVSRNVPEAKEGCWLGCAGISTLMVILAAVLLLYVATHRDRWRKDLAHRIRTRIETNLRRVFPEDTSPEAIRRLCSSLENRILSCRIDNKKLQRLRRIPVGGETEGKVAAREWADYLLALTETVCDGGYDRKEMERLKEWESQIDFQDWDAKTAGDFLERLNRLTETLPIAESEG